MSNFTYFTLSVDKGLRGNIGKQSIAKKKDGTPYMDMMLFLTPNSSDSDYKDQAAQIVNVHFPKAAFKKLTDYGLNDYVRIRFNRIDLKKGVSSKTGEDVPYITVKATDIELLKKAVKKEHESSEKQTAEADWE